jgi:hypothetical protein
MSRREMKGKEWNERWNEEKEGNEIWDEFKVQSEMRRERIFYKRIFLYMVNIISTFIHNII